MAKFKWSRGYRYPHGLKAQKAGEALEDIRKKEGILDAKTVLKKAKSPRHPLHDAFEWDDAIAGEKYRLTQAKIMIASIRIVPANKGEKADPERLYITIAPKGHGNGEYLPVAQVLNNKQLRAMALRKAVAELDSITRRYNDLVELVDVIDEIDKLKGKVVPVTQRRKRKAA